MQTRALGIASLIVGMMMMAYTGFHFITPKQDRQSGISISEERNQDNQWPLIAGIVLLVGGSLMVIQDKKVHVKIYPR